MPTIHPGGRKGVMMAANDGSMRVWWRYRLIFVIWFVFTALYTHSETAKNATTRRRTDVHLFGGAIDKEQLPLIPWYREIGITDAWIFPLKGAFPQDQRPDTQVTPAQLQTNGILEAYRTHQIRYWWFERPVPDFAYITCKQAGQPAIHLWDGSPETDAFWKGICEKAISVYPGARDAGFSGIVYDNEAYYSFQGDDSGKEKPWVWAGHETECGEEGHYYRRGLEVGRAIQSVWPKARIIMVYAYGYAGERWWYQGFHDAGLDVFIGPEHTYGAGPAGPGRQWFQSWWGGQKTKAVCDMKRTAFPFIPDNQHVIAGLFPVNFSSTQPNYRASYFREQLTSAAMDDPNGPIPVWLWPEGAFTPDSWRQIHYEEGDTAEDYLRVLHDFSTAADANEPAP